MTDIKMNSGGHISIWKNKRSKICFLCDKKIKDDHYLVIGIRTGGKSVTHRYFHLSHFSDELIDKALLDNL